jgi:hypothetical protein
LECRLALLPRSLAISLVAYLFTTVLGGRSPSLTDGVQRAFGRAPRDFAPYATKTAASGVWGTR